jgi:hypothetical protein
MSPQTETKAGRGVKAGVQDYRLTYYTPEYVVKAVTRAGAGRCGHGTACGATLGVLKARLYQARSLRR